jgi:hypothetical protein
MPQLAIHQQSTAAAVANAQVTLEGLISHTPRRSCFPGRRLAGISKTSRVLMAVRIECIRF